MVLPLSAALLALAVAQADPTGPPRPATAGGADSEPTSTEISTAPGNASRFAERVETGIPFQPDASPPTGGSRGTSLGFGVMSQVRAWTMGSTTSEPGWVTDLEVTPGVSIDLSSSTLGLGAGYAARLTIPFNAVGTDLSVLQRAYLRAEWRVAPLWTLGLSGGVTYGQNSQLVPIVTPGAPGVPPSDLNPIRSFTTYPYIGADGTISATTQVSRRTRLRLSAGYSDIGGLGTEGQAAQPRTWGPTADASLDWDFAREGTLTSSLSFVDSNVVDNFAIMLLTWRETWVQRWSTDLETTLSGGAALSSTDSSSFTGASHLLPVASVGLRYYTDVRHAFRFWFDAALAPYIDPYINATYQRVTTTLGLDWYAARGLFLGGYLSFAVTPQAALPPQAYGTAGLSVAWAPWTWLTISAGGFTQAQATTQGSFDIAAFRQWTTYLSITFRDTASL